MEELNKFLAKIPIFSSLKVGELKKLQEVFDEVVFEKGEVRQVGIGMEPPELEQSLHLELEEDPTPAVLELLVELFGARPIRGDAFDVLHGDEIDVLMLADFINLADERMIDRRRRARCQRHSAQMETQSPGFQMGQGQEVLDQQR